MKNRVNLNVILTHARFNSNKKKTFKLIKLTLTIAFRLVPSIRCNTASSSSSSRTMSTSSNCSTLKQLCIGSLGTSLEAVSRESSSYFTPWRLSSSRDAKRRGHVPGSSLTKAMSILRLKRNCYLFVISSNLFVKWIKPCLFVTRS